MAILDFQKPDKVIMINSDDYFGTFEFRPLEPGYGITIGNALRRVLLNSLEGFAVTSVKIEGVDHEFSTIKGVVEDVTEVILNLKKVRMRVLNKQTNKFEISLNGAGDLKAGDLQKSCVDIEILNPDLHLATLNDSAKFTMEIRFGFGKGYVPASKQNIPDQTIGIIPIDSIFTPIENVKYDIENVRIGESNEYEKLVLEVLTDGSVTPEEAMSGAGVILRDHINMFINFDVEQEEDKVDNEKDLEFERLRKILSTSVDDLELSVRSHNCLKAANIKTMGDLVRKDESEMLKFRNFGRKSLAELMEIVENYNLEFGMDVDKYLNDKTENN